MSSDDSHVARNVFIILGSIGLIFFFLVAVRRVKSVPGLLAFGTRIAYVVFMSMFGSYINNHTGPDPWKKEPINGKDLPNFNFHPFLMAMAFTVFGSEALMAYRGYLPLVGRSHAKAKGVHSVFNLLFVVFATAGVAIVFQIHNAGKQHNLASTHGWFGLTAYILLLFQLVFGVFAFLISSNQVLKKALLPFHKLFGVATYLTGILAMEIGLQLFVPDTCGNYCPQEYRLNGLSLVLWIIAFLCCAQFAFPNEKKEDEYEGDINSGEYDSLTSSK